MQIIHTVNELRSALKNKTSVGFVPTMGHLHAGHMQLVKIAQKHAEFIVVSIFVNPLQFGANEDLATYPRTLEDDCKKLLSAGVNIVFAPNTLEMYPDFDGFNLNQTMTIQLSDLENELCGASRPGHFSGVATVVMKLFNIVMPQTAVFGKKDFQQLFFIKQLVRQFNLPIKIISVDTVRESSGLAMSSRNSFLTEDALVHASQLNVTLQNVVNEIQKGMTDFYGLEGQAIRNLELQGWKVDYIAIRSPLSLLPATAADSQLIVLGAARLGSTRLIDNIEFCAKCLKRL